MTFTKPAPNRIESSDGFAVEFVGPAGVRYHERGRSLRLSREVLRASPGRKVGLVLSTNGTSLWDPPHDRQAIAPAERARIVANVRSAFEWAGQPVDVE